MRVLFHIQMSVYSRRTRLALAHKGLDAELRDAREDEANLVEARRLVPLRTMPVLLDGSKALGDSNAIVQYLDLTYPERAPLFPRAPDDAYDALAITSAVDVAMNALVDLGTRLWSLRADDAWPEMARERMVRARDAIEFVASKTTSSYLAGSAWSVADIWALSAVRWVAAMPARAATAPQIAQILTLGFQLPERLVSWAGLHESRPDVRAVYG